MNSKINITQWIEKFNQGGFDDPSVTTQLIAGWYDWFCKRESLAKKTEKLGKHLKQISTSPKINPETQYVFFKNNAPAVGSLYDDFRICDINSGDVIYTIVPKSGHKSEGGKGCVWGAENLFKEALFTGSWGEIKKWFNEPMEAEILNENEKLVLVALYQETLGCTGGDFGYTTDAWYPELGVTKQQYAGYVGQLVTKGMITQPDTEYSGQFCLQEAGRKIVSDLDKL